MTTQPVWLHLPGASIDARRVIAVTDVDERSCRVLLDPASTVIVNAHRVVVAGAVSEALNAADTQKSHR